MMKNVRQDFNETFDYCDRTKYQSVRNTFLI